jgi:hypothetical protein
MAKSTKRKDIKRAADRAEARSKGEEPEAIPTPIDPPEVAAKMGRPSAYKPEYAVIAEKYCKAGATDAELADLFEVSVGTISNWKIQYPEFLRANAHAKEFADDRVERSLYLRAVGYQYDAVKIFLPAGAKEPVIVPYREIVPPDVTAALKWLHNRRPQTWRDVQRHEIGKPGDFSDLTDEQLDQIIREELPAVASETVKKLRGAGKTKH